MKTRLFFGLVLCSSMTYAQVLTAINEDSTHTERFRPGQFIECLITGQNNSTLTVRGRLKLFYPASFLLETQPNQFSTVYLADLEALRRIRQGKAWAAVLGGGYVSGTGATQTNNPLAQKPSAAGIIGAAVSGIGLAALTGAFSPVRYRWSIYQGWQFSVQGR